MRIKIIADGSSKWKRFIGKWGISFLIDNDLLFDAFGDAYTFLQNIQRYNVDLSKIKHIVISHDHWDHIIGLWYVIKTYKDATVCICNNFSPEIKDRIKSFGVNAVEVTDNMEIKDKIYSTGQLLGKTRNKTIYEQSLIIKTQKGLVIITGCAHPGIINIIDKIKEHFNENIYLVMGGFHLVDSNREQISEVVSKLRAYGINKVAPMHCTGAEAVKMFKEEFRDDFVSVKTGSIIDC